jgi:hypothetical protein
MKSLSILSFILLLTVLMSCETEIQFNGEETAPVLTVNCLPNTNSTLEVEVTASLFFLSNETSFKSITNATIHLYVNGILTDTLTNVGQGFYESSYIPLEGDVIRLNASAPDYEPVWTEETFPALTGTFQIDSTVTKTDTSLIIYNYGYYSEGYGIDQLDTVGYKYSYIHQFKIQFSNPAGQENFYRLLVHYRYTQDGYQYDENYMTGFDDIVFGTQSSSSMDGILTENNEDNQYNIFSDELIDGKTHTITFSYMQDFNFYYDNNYYGESTSIERSITIDLQSISKSYYLFLKSLNSLDGSDPFLSEQVQVYTNVQGGLGIFAPFTKRERKFNLP